MTNYGEENFSFEILEECADEVINEREQHWVSHFDSFNPNKGYNLTNGGDGRIRYEVTVETREKIRAARAKQVITPEHRLKIGLGLKLANLSPDVRKNRKAGQAKRSECTQETKQKRSISMKKAFESKESRIKRCSKCNVIGHYKLTCEVKS